MSQHKRCAVARDVVQLHIQPVTTGGSMSSDVPMPKDVRMHGFSLHGAETAGAGDYNPLAFSLLGQALPGQPFDGEVLAGTAVRVMTGAAVPTGADAVVPAEYAQE